MKVVILAGGFGTRISEESHLKPKPMIEIGDQPILWHIMKIYSSYGYNDFVVCLGYKAYMIKEFFSDYFLHTSDVAFDLPKNEMTILNNYSEPWKVTLIDTGLNTMTGGRVKRIQPYIGNEPFMLTYGDGVSDVNIKELVEFHQQNGKMATLTAIRPEGRFGVLDMDGNKIQAFREKSRDDGGWINGGFMVLQPEIFDYIADDSTVFEKYPLETAAATDQLMSYKHEGFWQCMDTQRDKQKLEELWFENKAPWKVW
ncbi:MAG: glucose-1-phosphate cytidylyltransferase [Clostridiales bacterium 43-6]|nr:MAG: glucose-1-phosphate cytidylyltransferase [Clostridiales bacterium 43-6]